ncbi:cytochrome o ubiquinol oxidase subunit IV [Methyloceanibacter methanicus]|uniref:Cytochrome bo(3) ubiquinol oxidase subunit 4 n=1 Tax=Methyloceanibacter methanicus TaxID=1774968 RepID=A0A1E3W4P0_9HYPH|nr:cytochrome o ubiquinol oxidase subunit IV [Methyloceanibacter methanicus]ODS00778.1 cytochrome o ubiquinol oxidase subunit IV [Methyloceanibacter methanicus]
MEIKSGLPIERTIKPYLIGLALAVVLTAIPFGLVAAGSLPRQTTLIVIAVLAVIQILVHLRFFLHIDFKTTPRENLVALAFAVVLICIMVGGSLWIMFDLYHRMMV